MTTHADNLRLWQWLTGDDGERMLARIATHEAQGLSPLRISELLRADNQPDHIALALTLAGLRHHATTKFPDAHRLFFTRDGLEQATAAHIARHRARRFRDAASIVDLCCGLGGDLLALAAETPADLTAVDIDPVHLLLAEANLAIAYPDRDAQFVLADVRDVPLDRASHVFIDPARRSAKGRMGGHASEPPLEWALALADRVAGIGITAAPGIPHHQIPARWEFEAIALGPDLKEAALWSPSLANGSRTATVIIGNDAHSLHATPGDPVDIVSPEPGMWLLDPNPAVTRAGLVEDLARLVDAVKIDDEVAFLVAPHPVQSPFARSLPVLASLPWHEQRVKEALRRVDAGPVDVRRRGLAGDVAAITKRLRGRGSRPVMVAMTRHRDQPWAILCDATPIRDEIVSDVNDPAGHSRYD